jgi:gamma-glutamylcyclotransferase (GGCT)/AIG2-like uncharacterized protein YtfP
MRPRTRQGEGAFIGKGDKEVFFSYWFSLLSELRFSGLRRYLARCGYERLAANCGAPDDEHVMFYGTLMNNSPRQEQLGVDGKLRLVGDASLVGSMYELPTCPGVMQRGSDVHRVEVYRVTDRAVLPILDDFEEYFPDDQPGSRFLRRSIWVEEHRVDAWVYFLAESALSPKAVLVTDGSWAEFVQRTGKVLSAELPPNTYRHEYGE